MSGDGRGKAGWAAGRPRGLLSDRRGPAPGTESGPAPGTESSPRPDLEPAGSRLAGLAGRAPGLAAAWAPTLGRIALGRVFAWFGYHELEHPGNWTGYVPVLSETSNLAIVAVLIHGWVLWVLAAGLIAGIQPRLAAALASVILLEIVISLAVTGLTDTALRDLGILGLAVCLTGAREQRLTLSG
jgi:uncharacterized membrane protein YphA (DoxX/SURF4 family)